MLNQSMNSATDHKFTKDQIQRQADELIEEQDKIRRQRKSLKQSTVSTNNPKQVSKLRANKNKRLSQNFNSSSAKIIHQQLKTSESGMLGNIGKQQKDEMKEWDRLIMKQNKLNQDALNEIIEKNNQVELQIQDPHQQLMLSEPFTKLLESKGELPIVETKLAYNSPLTDLKLESKKFNQQIQALKYELEYKINVVTEKQVEESIKAIQDKTNAEIKERLKEQQLKDQKNLLKINEQEQSKAYSQRKVKDLVRVLQDFIKRKRRILDRKFSQDKQKNDNISDKKERRILVSKWDVNDKASKIVQPFNNQSFRNKNNSFLSRNSSQTLSTLKAQSKNFIEFNINHNTDLNRQIFQEFGPSFDKNLPYLEQRSGFNRSEIIQIFTKFKALCEMTKEELKSQGQDFTQCKGVSFDKFKLAIPELKYETEKFAKRVFDQCTTSANQNHPFNAQLEWEQFFLAVKAIQARNIDQKIDLFFKIIDYDGNGRLSYDEVFEICADSFEKFTVNSSPYDEDAYLRGLTEFFATVIFRAVGRELNEEIPLSEIKQAIDKKLPDSDILCLFCNADIIEA